MAESAVMRVDLVSPERVLFTGEAIQVITRTLGGGEVAFLPGHAPFLAALVENHTRIYLSDGTIQHAAVHGGFVEVSNNTVSILSDVAELGQDIDVARARQALELAQAQAVASHAPEAVTMAAVARAQARLAAAGAGDTVHAGH